MAIGFRQEGRIFTLDTKHTSYRMKVDEYGFLLHLYYGGRVYGNMDYLLTCYDRGFSGNPWDVGNDRTYSLDVLPQEYPVMGVGDFRNSALIVRNADGSDCCDLRYIGHEIKKGKYGLPGLPAVYDDSGEAQTLEITLGDKVSGMRVTLLYGVLEEADIITRSVILENRGNKGVTVEKAASACLDFVTGSFDMLSFYGRHTMERNLQREALRHGTYAIGSRRGTSSHQYNPAVILADRSATEDAGNCYGMLFVYSGNFLCEAERDQYDQTRLLMGLQSDLFHYTLEQGEKLTVPETILCYSDRGLGLLSARFHACIGEHLCRGKFRDAPRPVLLNSWEAAYFTFDGQTILKLAKSTAALGIDMIVMDDGWFGKREDDNSGLGDWQVNEKKLGCTLRELIDKVNSEGVKFGIWIEPEMVSEDSELYRKHPDWALRIPGREPVRGRNQLVLDFTRKDVRDYIFEQICGILDQGKIEYVKWDMNRSIVDVFSEETAQGKVTYQYVLGVYEFLERLLQRYPDILLEGCSDNTDALDRLRIQYGTSFFYPASTVCSHVSAVPNHQTGRSVSLHTRGVVAMAGAFGYELDPEKLTEEEKASVREQIRKYKGWEALIRRGSYYRLSDPFAAAYTAWMFVSKDRSRALLSVVMLEMHGNMTVSYVKLKGLDDTSVYRDTESGRRYYGADLMEAGLPMPVEQKEYPAYQIELIRET